MERMDRVNELVHRELSKVIAEEIEFPMGSLATITKVEVTPDLKEARISVSILPEKESGRTIKVLISQSFRLQKVLNKKIKLRIVPKLLFFSDDTEARAEEIDRLLDSIKE